MLTAEYPVLATESVSLVINSTSCTSTFASARSKFKKASLSSKRFLIMFTVSLSLPSSKLSVGNSPKVENDTRGFPFASTTKFLLELIGTYFLASLPALSRASFCAFLLNAKSSFLNCNSSSLSLMFSF